MIGINVKFILTALFKCSLPNNNNNTTTTEIGKFLSHNVTNEKITLNIALVVNSLIFKFHNFGSDLSLLSYQTSLMAFVSVIALDFFAVYEI